MHFAAMTTTECVLFHVVKKLSFLVDGKRKIVSLEPGVVPEERRLSLDSKMGVL